MSDVGRRKPCKHILANPCADVTTCTKCGKHMTWNRKTLNWVIVRKGAKI